MGLIRREPDPVIRTIVSGWATDFDARRARELGFTPKAISTRSSRIHIEDELGGRI